MERGNKTRGNSTLKLSNSKCRSKDSKATSLGIIEGKIWVMVFRIFQLQWIKNLITVENREICIYIHLHVSPSHSVQFVFLAL